MNAGSQQGALEARAPGTARRFCWARSALLLGLVALLSTVGTSCKPASRPPAPLDLTIHFTCDTHGRLVPCGCFVGQFGGMTRLKTVLDASTAANELRLDVGDAIGGTEDYHLMEYGQMLRAYAGMHFDALNIGHREARLSAAQLLELKRTSPVPLISANLLDKATGQALLTPWRLLTRGAFTIAVVGVLDPRGLGDELGAGLALDRMETTLSRVLGEVRARADLVVLLAFTDEATLVKLAREFYELDIVLGGKVSQPAQALVRENRSLIYFVTNESRALGALRIELAGKSRVRELASDILLLTDGIPEHPAIQALAAEYRARVKRTPLAVDSPERLQQDLVPGVRMVAGFVGSQPCIECHKQAGRVWQRSGHARAFATLVDKAADGDPKCIACHVIGFGTVSGYRRQYGATKLVDVGCESCHGPGSLHVRQQEGDKTVSFKFRPLGAEDCQKCHYGEFSRPFDWHAFWEPVAHGTEKAMQRQTVSASRADKSGTN